MGEQSDGEFSPTSSTKSSPGSMQSLGGGSVRVQSSIQDEGKVRPDGEVIPSPTLETVDEGKLDGVVSPSVPNSPGGVEDDAEEEEEGEEADLHNPIDRPSPDDLTRFPPAFHVGLSRPVHRHHRPLS